MDARLVLEALVHADIDLGRQAITTGIDRCADDGREARLDERLATHDDEDARPLGITLWMSDSEEVSAFQRSA